MTLQYFAWNIFVFSPKHHRLALKVHVLWCKTGIYSWNLSEKVSLMYEDSFPISLLCNLKYTSLYFIYNSVKSSCKWLIPFRDSFQIPFLKLIPGALFRSVNFKIPKRFLCRLPVFPDYLSVSCYCRLNKERSD